MNDLYAAVVHDVANQLAGLSLRLGARGDAQKEMGIVMSAARRLSEMLLVHRQENQLLSVNPDSVNASDFVAILAAEFRELFPHLNIEVNDEKAPSLVFFDDALVRMAMANAMYNACRIAHTKVWLSAYERDKMLVLEVVDDGPGYPDSLLAAGITAPSRVSQRGTGLGLYLAKKIAELHHLEGKHGCVELSNAGGAVFRMILP
jgi:two-component system sensor histidine kinase PilS (NtrC family)